MPQIDDQAKREYHTEFAATKDIGGFKVGPRNRAGVYGKYLKRAIFEGLWRCDMPLAEDELLTLVTREYYDQFRADLELLPHERGGRHLDTVSRTPLRTALASLEERRLTERGKAGKAVPRALTARDRTEIFEARLLIEPLGAERAVLMYQKSPSFKKRLDAIWDGLEKAVTCPDQIGRYIELDIAFHAEIARASSEVLGLIVEITLEQTVVGGRRSSEFADYLKQVAPRKKQHTGIHAEHRDVYDAISHGSGDDALAKMKTHVKEAQVRIEDVARFLNF